MKKVAIYNILILTKNNSYIATLLNHIGSIKNFNIITSTHINTILVGENIHLAIVHDSIATADNLAKVQQLSEQKIIPCLVLQKNKMKNVKSKYYYYELGYAAVLEETITKKDLRARLTYFIQTIDSAKQQKNIYEKYLDNNQQLLSELEVASLMHEKIITTNYSNPKYLQHSFSPTALYNGDLMLCEKKPNGSIVVFLGKFTNRGIPMAIGSTPTAEIFFDMTMQGFSLEHTIKTINKKLNFILPAEVYCACCFLEYDTVKAECKIFNAGFPEIIQIDKNNKVLASFAANNVPLGVMPDEKFSAIPTLLPAGTQTRLVAYTNNLIALRNSQGQRFGIAGVKQAIANASKKTGILAAIDKSIINYTNNKYSLLHATIIELSLDKQTKTIMEDVIQANKITAKPIDWSFKINLPAKSLQNLDPIPLLLDMLMQQPALEPYRPKIFTILSELYANALDHGVLNLDSKSKSDIAGFSDYYRLRQDRLSALQSGYIDIAINNILKDDDTGALEITVEDSGEGFDYKKFNTQKSTKNKRYSGRGQALLSELCESVLYSGKGNVIKVVFKWT